MFPTIIKSSGDQEIMMRKVHGTLAVPYKADLEIGRAPMALGKTAAPVEQLTISVDDTPAGATLRLEWGGTVPFAVGK